MATRQQTKRTIKLREADALGREYIRVSTNKSTQWASCGKKNGAGSVKLAFKRSDLALDLMSLGEGIGQAGVFLTIGAVFTFGATAVIGVPSILIGAAIKQTGKGMHWVAFHENKKPCDAHAGLF